MLTIAYITFRLRPRFEWFASSLARELRDVGLDPKDTQIVVIDGRLWYDETRAETLRTAAAGRIAFEHHPPKPSPWQGPSRQTSKDYFCAASVRNTAFAYVRGEHVAFVDDLSVLLPGWLKAHLEAAAGGYVLAGITCKQKNIRVSEETGHVLSFDKFPPGRDSRLSMAGVAEGGLVTCSGGSLFGGTFSVPLEAALAINGQDEKSDTIGGEDYDFGIRLERAGCPIKITSACATFEDEDGHHAESPMVRLDKPWSGPDGPYSSNFLLNTLMREKSRTWTTGNNFILRDVRAAVLAGGEFPRVEGGQAHWVDHQPLMEM